MDDLQEQDLLDEGFEPEMKLQYSNRSAIGNSEVRTGSYVLNMWNPTPRVQFNTARRSIGWIGALQSKIENKADLDKFLNKCVPTFCELK